jgi:hypothetical protein
MSDKPLVDSGPKPMTPDRTAVPDPRIETSRNALPSEPPQPDDVADELADFPPSGHESAVIDPSGDL